METSIALGFHVVILKQTHSSLLYFLFHLCVYFVDVGLEMCLAPRWKSEVNLWEFVLSLHHVHPRMELRLAARPFNSLSHYHPLRAMFYI